MNIKHYFISGIVALASIFGNVAAADIVNKDQITDKYVGDVVQSCLYVEIHRNYMEPITEEEKIVKSVTYLSSFVTNIKFINTDIVVNNTIDCVDKIFRTKNLTLKKDGRTSMYTELKYIMDVHNKNFVDNYAVSYLEENGDANIISSGFLEFYLFGLNLFGETE